MEIKCISSGPGYTDPLWNEQRLITYPVKKISKEYRNFHWQSMMNISVAILRLCTHIWNRRKSSTPSGMSLRDRRHLGYWREHYVIAEDTNLFGQCTKLQRCSDMKISLENLGRDADYEIKFSSDSIIRHESMDVAVKTSVLVPHNLIISGILCLSVLIWKISRLTFIFSSCKCRVSFPKSNLWESDQSWIVITRWNRYKHWRT